VLTERDRRAIDEFARSLPPTAGRQPARRPPVGGSSPPAAGSSHRSAAETLLGSVETLQRATLQLVRRVDRLQRLLFHDEDIFSAWQPISPGLIKLLDRKIINLAREFDGTQAVPSWPDPGDRTRGPF
jgi:hypothetical protein